jgi:hypothetical protein
MDDMSNGNWKLRRESMFHSIIEEQLSTATLSMFDCASLVPQNFVRMRYLPAFRAAREGKSSSSTTLYQISNLAPAGYLQPNKEGPFAVRNLS